MAGEVNVTFLRFEALGNQVAKAQTYGVSGQTSLLPMLDGEGAVYQHGAAALTVPMQVISLTSVEPAHGEGAMIVPRQVAAGSGGGTTQLTVPMQVLGVTATFPIIGRAGLTVPLQVISGSGKVGAALDAGLTVPMQTLLAYGAGNVALAVPMQTLAGHGIGSVSATLAGHVPLQQGTGTISVFSYPGEGAVTVPLIVAGPYASAALGVPMQQLVGVFAIPAGFEAWVMNVRNGGVTRWTNFPFVQFARAGDSTYAVGGDGNLYLLGGDLDDDAPIQWSFETGLDDLGRPGQKHMPYLYMDGIIDGEIEIAVIDDHGRVFGYEYNTGQRGAVHLTHRRKLGNGIRTNNVAFRFSSTSGAYIELDWFAPEATVTQRNI